MGITIGGETGRSAKAKGWILYRLEDERAEATGRYAEELEREIGRIRIMEEQEFSQTTKKHRLIGALYQIQRAAGLVNAGEDLRPPLSEAVRRAIE